MTSNKIVVAVHQPQYLPWLGYFDKIDKSDKFFFLDTVQFKKNEWQNRNKVKTAQGWQWLTVPTLYKFPEKIGEVRINKNIKWQHKHMQSLISNYSRAPYFTDYIMVFQEIFERGWDYLSPLNICLTKKIIEILRIKTDNHIVSELGDTAEDPDERLIRIVKKAGGTHYLAGSGGRNYMNLSKYDQEGINVIFQDFTHPVYAQLFGAFEPCMSIVDLIFNHGERSLSIIRGES